VNQLDILGLLCVGESPAKICRDGAADYITVLTLKTNAGRASLWYQDRALRKLMAPRIYLDVTPIFEFAEGTVWTWLALDAERKLIVSWALGDRDSGVAAFILEDVLSRCLMPTGVTMEDTEGEIVELATGSRIDTGLIRKTFGPAWSAHESVMGSHILLQGQGQFSEAQQDAIEDHAHSMAISALYHNFIRVRDRVTPAMAAGIVHTSWTVQSVASMIDLWQEQKTGSWYERVSVLREDSSDL
jgi:hypothetical protein